MLALTQINAWKQLEYYKQSHCDESHLRLLNSNKASRAKKYLVTAANITIDYSEQFVDDQVLQLLFSLAEECGLQEKISQLLSGHHVNTSEQKPALHSALRTTGDEQILVNGHNIIPEILHVRKQMRDISIQLRKGEWLGYSGKPITDIVNVGIGGSFLGPIFCTKSLIDYTTDKLNFHFISDIDPHEFQRALKPLNPETTLFIIASKSFTTKETLCNMDKAILWLGQSQHIDRHIIAITANEKKAKQFGINNVLPIWDWVGGRYSTCSAINLITCIAIGFEHFSEMLAGAREMDIHFQNTEFSHNVPVLLALLGIWNINFLKIHNLLMLLYFYDLQHFIPYMQQLDMESNGKSIDKEGRIVNYATGPIIWGGPGHQVQHSYFQLLCQGTHRVAADLISVDALENEMANKICNAHQKVLSNGMSVNHFNPFKSCKTPTNHVSLFDWTPKTLGALMALYEHKIFTQSVIWNINPFDQPGVELSKQIIG